MNRSMTIAIGAVWTIGLVILGLWGWQHAEAVVSRVGWEKRAIGVWAVKCMAAALMVVAQAILLSLVVERVYRRDPVCAAAKLSALLLFMVCTASAIALGLAGR